MSNKTIALVSGLCSVLVVGCNDYGVGRAVLGENRSGAVRPVGDDTDDTDDTGDDTGDTDDTDDTDDTGGDDDDDDGESDLPYDVRLEIGDTFVLTYAFLEEGPAPAEILSVTMEDGGTWRLAEIASLTAFVVDQTDCDHEGNRDQGRDRIEIRWRNANGSEDSDHLDLRYCGA